MMISTAPTRPGTSGTTMPREARTVASSHTARGITSTTSPMNAGFHHSSDATTTTPRPTPTAIAAGRFRPLRPCDATSPDDSAASVPSVLTWTVTGPSDVEQLCFLALEQFVDGVHGGLGQRLELLLPTCGLILTDVAVLDRGVHGVLGLAPDTADRDLGVLGLAPGDLDVVLAAFLGQLRQDDPQLSAVVRGVHPEIGLPDGLLDRVARALVVGVHGDHPRVDHVEGGQLVQRRGRTVVIHRDPVEQGWVCPSGTNDAEIVLGDLDRLLHLLLGLEEALVDHRCSSRSVWGTRRCSPSTGSSFHVVGRSPATTVPMRSPRMARAMPSCSPTPKTTIGRLLSLHRLNAAGSATCNWRRSTSA